MSNHKLHYFSDEEVQLQLKVGDLIEYYDRYAEELVVAIVEFDMYEIASSERKSDTNRTRYLIKFFNLKKQDPFYELDLLYIRGLACNTRKITDELLLALYSK